MWRLIVHEYAPLAITPVAIFAGILINKSDLKDFKGDMKELKADMLARFDRTDKRIDDINSRLLVIESDFRQFFSITGELRGRMDALEKRR